MLHVTRQKGFTLIELLVTIGIIATLIGLGSVYFGSARMKARDAKRKSDLKELQKAIEFFRQGQTTIAYPDPSLVAFLNSKDQCWTSGGIGASCPAGTIYMNKLAVDPDSSSATTIPYSYQFSNTALTYSLCACLESADDPDGQSGSCDTTAGYPASNARTCTSAKRYVVNQP